jgi:hypothetical protein
VEQTESALADGTSFVTAFFVKLGTARVVVTAFSPAQLDGLVSNHPRLFVEKERVACINQWGETEIEILDAGCMSPHFDKNANLGLTDVSMTGTAFAKDATKGGTRQRLPPLEPPPFQRDRNQLRATRPLPGKERSIHRFERD